MSFTIRFYSTDDHDPPDEARILDVLDRVPHLARHGDAGDYQLLYENRDTGVEFTLDYRDAASGEADDDEYAFGGRTAIGLSATVAYLRPSFFGLEAFPWIAFVAEALGLEVFDAQREGATRTGPTAADATALFASWEASNARATRTLRSQEGIRMARGDRAMLDAWWRYVHARDDLATRHGDARVVTPWLGHDERSGTVVSIADADLNERVVWPADATLFHLQRERRRFRIVSVVERGTVARDAVVHALAGAIERHDEPVPHLVFSPSRVGDAERDALAALGIDVRARFGPVLATRLTDVPVD